MTNNQIARPLYVPWWTTLFALFIAFAAGWLAHEFWWRDERNRLMEIQASAMQLTASSTTVAARALEHANSYQETLNGCLVKLRLQPVTSSKEVK